MMRYGLSEQTIGKINSVFARHPVVEKAMLYGSRAKGNYKPGSDIDLTLYGSDISLKEKDRILDELDALDLPYTIDLSVFSRLTHAKLREHIERVGIVFYQRSGESPTARAVGRDGSGGHAGHEEPGGAGRDRRVL